MLINYYNIKYTINNFLKYFYYGLALYLQPLLFTFSNKILAPCLQTLLFNNGCNVYSFGLAFVRGSF